jgi:hypothetical protein
MKRPKMPRKYRANSQSPEPDYCVSRSHRLVPGDHCQECGKPIPPSLEGDQPRLEPVSDDARAEKWIGGSTEPLGNKLDELQWRILTRIDPDLLRYCSDGQYLIALRIGPESPAGPVVVSAAAARTANSDRLVVTVEGPEVSLEHCCEFCARPATYRQRATGAFVCGQCAHIEFAAAAEFEPL